MRYIVLLLFVVLLGSCRSKKEVTTTDTKEMVQDSTYTTKKIVLRDSVLTVPADSIKLSIPITDLSETPIIQSSGRTTARVSLVNDNLSVTCLTEQYEQLIQIQSEIITTLREYIKTTRTNTKKTITKTPWYTSIVNTILPWLIVLLILVVAFKIIKPF